VLAFPVLLLKTFGLMLAGDTGFFLFQCPAF
jgi:hypothetical protein